MLTLEIKLPIASESDIVDMYVESVQKEFNFAGYQYFLYSGDITQPTGFVAILTPPLSLL